MGQVVIAARSEDWPERLNAIIDTRRATHFAWGIQDCCTFAADGVQAMTGADPMFDLRGRYGSREDADILLVHLGGLIRATSARLGRHIPPRLARRGDVVLVETGGARALGICLGAFIAAPGPRGLEWPGMEAARVAWRIG